MQQLRKNMLVVCLLAGMTVGAASTATGKAHRAGKMDDGIIATILGFFGMTLENKVSIPPG
jgi:hypothetical protein